MPSPFPGMDPYLENPNWFPDLHGSLIIFTKGSLQHALPGDYFAQSSQRVWLEYTHRHVEPDVQVAHAVRRKGPGQRARGGVAVAERRPAAPVVLSVEEIEHGPFHESFVEIRHRKGKETRLVTSIEVLSPSNKMPRNPSREQYLTKQREVLDSEVHLVEIDLLRGGTHTTAAPRALAKAKAGPFDYHVSVHRFDRPNEFFFYPILMTERLPTIGIPLLPGDADVMLDLQTIFDQAYDFGPYQRETEYGADPVVPPLRPERARWVAALLKTRK
jgi:hypothetical protein